ncbi:MAG: sel1 repeat family protein [Clostridia bacterium]|nr:sel1 repeat family protein [Clostridia bacterium]
MKDKMKTILPGDLVGRIEDGDYVYYTVRKIEAGKLICTYLDDDFDEEFDDDTVRLNPAKVDHYPLVTVSADQVRSFLRYEASYTEIFGDVRPCARLRCEETVIMSGENLLTAFRRCKEEGFDAAEEAWLNPAGHLFDKLFVFSKDAGSGAPVDGYRHLPSAAQLLFRLFAPAVWPWQRDTDVPDFDELIAKTEETIRMLSLPVPARPYADDDKEHYIRMFDNDDMQAAATDDEIALWVQYVDELCEKENRTALYAKAYSFYGGNRAYACDWCGARDLLLKLMEIDENPFLANTLGYIFYYGRCTDGVPEYEKAFYYYNIGAAGGIYESRYKLSDMYRHGYGVKKNHQIASGIIHELYRENLKYIQRGHTDCKFADVALRMGNLRRDGIVGETPDPDDAYWYYLQADFAIRQRLRDCNWYGDTSVAAGIGKAIDEILPATSYAKPCYTIRMWSVAQLLSSAFALHRRVEAKIRKLRDGQYSLRFRIQPMKGEKNPPRFFVTLPQAHFCGYLDHITVKTEELYDFRIDGRRFEGEAATVIFDDIDYAAFEFYGACVMELNAVYVLKLPSKEKGETYGFVSVTFSDGGRHYDYRCDLPGIRVGDEVIVPSRDGEARVRVAAVFERTESETTLPIAKYKSVLRKA